MYITISRSTQFPFYRRRGGGERDALLRLEVEARRLHNTYPPLWKRQSEPLEIGRGGRLDLVSRNYQLIIYVYAEPGGGSKAYLPLFPIPERGECTLSVLLRILTCVARVRGAKGFSSGPLLHILEVFSTSHYGPSPKFTAVFTRYRGLIAPWR